MDLGRNGKKKKLKTSYQRSIKTTVFNQKAIMTTRNSIMKNAHPSKRIKRTKKKVTQGGKKKKKKKSWSKKKKKLEQKKS
jgi:hypothetical protein